MWRYREILPLFKTEHGYESPVTLGEGWTPLVSIPRIAKTLGLDRVLVKDESQNPTGTVRARGLSTAATRARHLGMRVMSIATSDATAQAVAAYAARAGLDSRVFVPKDMRKPLVRSSELAGAHVTTVDGGAAEAETAEAESGAPHAWYNVGPFREPYRLEGDKTLAYEIAEQLNWQLPDWIVCPVGSGSTLIGMWKALGEMTALGWIDPSRRTHLVAVQASGCAPLVRAFASNAEKAAPWDQAKTLADGLRVPETRGDFLVLRALAESGGTALSAGDAEMIDGMKEFGRSEGISASLEGGAALHAVRVLANQGRIKPHDTVVIVNTGGAFTALDVLG